jgi:hypothetical protein
MSPHQFDNIHSYPHPLIIENRNIKNVMVAAVCLLLGCFLIFNSLFFNLDTGLIVSFVILGISCISFGIILYAVQSKQKTYTKTGSIIKAPIFYFSREYLHFAEQLLANGSFETKKTIPLLSDGNVYLNILSSRDNRFAVIQIFEHTSQSNEPITPVYTFEEEKSLLFWEYINRCKTNTKRLKYNLR